MSLVFAHINPHFCKDFKSKVTELWRKIYNIHCGNSSDAQKIFVHVFNWSKFKNAEVPARSFHYLVADDFLLQKTVTDWVALLRVSFAFLWLQSVLFWLNICMCCKCQIKLGEKRSLSRYTQSRSTQYGFVIVILKVASLGVSVLRYEDLSLLHKVSVY